MVDGGDVVAQVEGNLGHGNGGGDYHLLAGSAADDGCVDGDVGLDPDQAPAVNDLAVVQEQDMSLRLRDGVSPLLRLDESLQTLEACLQLAKSLVDAVRSRNGASQFFHVSVVRPPQKRHSLDAAEFEKSLQKVTFAGCMIRERRRNMDHNFHF